MDITTVRNGIYMLSAGREELQMYYITKEYASDLISRALGLPTLPHDTVIELYEGRDSVLIFAQLPRTYYCFENFEDVISACKSCTADESALYFYDEEYILSVSFPNALFAEFAYPLPAGHGYDLFLKEHGQTVISQDAVNFVKNTF